MKILHCANKSTYPKSFCGSFDNESFENIGAESFDWYVDFIRVMNDSPPIYKKYVCCDKCKIAIENIAFL